VIKKYGLRILFVLALGLCGAVATVQLGVIVLRWQDNMTKTQGVQAGERAFAMPAGSLPRVGGELVYAKEDREAAAARRNPVPAGPESVRKGEGLWVIYCTPCHGASGKGDGLVTTKFVPSVDLTNPDLHKSRSDGYWQHQLSVGGPLMPAYAEALSPEERWDLVNYVRTLAKK
jgi:mono/diheme cytochrome c family protein